MCRGLGHCPLGSALTGVSQQPSPRYQYRMTLIKKTGKEGSTRWVAERDSLAGPRMCGPHGHSVAAGGHLHPTVHSGRLPLLGITLSLSSILPFSCSLVGSSLQIFQVCHAPSCGGSVPLHIQIPCSERPPLCFLPCCPLETLLKPCLRVHLLCADSRAPTAGLASSFSTRQADHVAICFACTATEARCSAFCLAFRF